MSYETCLLNGHGVGGRTPAMKYYNAKGAEDRPNGMAFYGTNGALYADRIGYEVYPEPKKPGSAESPLERKQMNTTDATAAACREFHRLRAHAKQAGGGGGDRPPVDHGGAPRQHCI